MTAPGDFRQQYARARQTADAIPRCLAEPKAAATGSMCRRFHGAPVRRLIVSVPAEQVRMVDELLRSEHAARGCRAEFVRLAIAEKLQRDLMITAAPKARAAQSADDE